MKARRVRGYNHGPLGRGPDSTNKCVWQRRERGDEGPRFPKRQTTLEHPRKVDEQSLTFSFGSIFVEGGDAVDR